MRVIASLLSLLISATAYAAGDAAATATTGSLDIETHATSNALDNDLGLPDTFMLLRGALSHTVLVGDGHLKVGGEFEASAFDTYDLEDDRKLGLLLERLIKLSPRLELRGTLTYAVLDEGDDLRIGAAALGTRTTTQTLAAGLEAGLDLGSGWTMVLGATRAHDRSGLTRFQDDLLPATKLEPDRRRLRLSAALRRKHGRHHYGGIAEAELLDAEPLGELPVARSYTSWRLRGEYGFDPGRGVTLAVQAGAEWLRDSEGLYDSVRPVYAAAISVPVWRRLAAKASLRGFFETVDTDDPLASYVNRGELELALPVSTRAGIGAGVFAENKRNLLLENDERSRGLYGELSYALSPTTKAVLRLDHGRTFITVLDTVERTTAVFLRLSSRL